MVQQPYAEIPSEIPLVGNRRIRAKPWKVFATSTLVAVPLYVGVGLLVVFAHDLFDGTLWSYLNTGTATGTIALAVFWLALLGVALMLPAWFGRLLVRERRILRIGMPVVARIAAVEQPVPDVGQGYSGSGSINYLYEDSGQLRQGETDYGGGSIDVGTVMVDPDNPKRHVILRRSYYRILKDAGSTTEAK